MKKIQEEYISQIRNIKIFQLFIAALLCVTFGINAFAINGVMKRVDATDAKTEKIGNFIGYSEKDKVEESTSSKAKEFINSKFVTDNLLAKDTTKEKIFSLSDEEYYVMFYMDACAHCETVESKMDTYVQRTKKLPMYFYNAGQIDNSTKIQWTSDSIKEMPEKITADNLSIIGTPTLIKVKDNKAISFVGADDINKELGL